MHKTECESCAKSKGSSFLNGTFFGILLGLAAGILLAPESGKKNREKVKKVVEKGKQLAEVSKQEIENLEPYAEKLKPVANEIKEKVSNLLQENQKIKSALKKKPVKFFKPTRSK